MLYHCNTCEISANQLMNECPSCGAQFEHLSARLRLWGHRPRSCVLHLSSAFSRVNVNDNTTPKFQLIYVKVLIPLLTAHGTFYDRTYRPARISVYSEEFRLFCKHQFYWRGFI